MRMVSVSMALLVPVALVGVVLSGCGTPTRPPVIVDKPDMAMNLFPSCDDNILNQDEGDIDCGGECPKKCADGLNCKAKTDCVSGLCVLGSCAVANICSDTVKDGDETDIDCGGSCPPCRFGRVCGKPVDCLSNVCTANACAALKGALTAGKSRTMGTNPVNVDTGDFDGDGKLDLISLSGTDEMAAISLQKADGTFGNPTLISVPRAESPDTLAIGDVNGDGKPDIVYTNSPNVGVMLNDSPMVGMVSFKKAVTSLIGSDPGSPKLVDMDGDGKLDLITCDTSFDSGINGYNVYVSTNQGDGKWKVLRKIFDANDRPSSPVITDFTDDGKVDIGVLIGGKVGVSVQRPDGTFGPWIKSATGTLVPNQMIAYDFDPDFLTDVVVLDSKKSSYGAMKGDGMGTLLKPTPAMSMSGPTRMALVDFDLDDKYDFAVANYDADTASVFFGQGLRVFKEGATAATCPSPTYVIVRDINLDRKPDIITVCPSSDMVSVMINKSM